MTKEEIRKFLNNTKVYVDGRSEKIQKKLFSLGYNWLGYKDYKIQFTESPFLFMSDNGEITHSDNMNFFKSQKYREISAEKILSLEITEPSYRPFKTKEECWNEMLKHQPFGWLYHKRKGDYIPIREKISTNTEYTYWFNEYTFADGTPFGILEK